MGRWCHRSFRSRFRAGRFALARRRWDCDFGQLRKKLRTQKIRRQASILSGQLPAAPVRITGATFGRNGLIIAPIMRTCLFCPARPLMQLTFLVGTVHGNARQIAQSLAFAAPDYGVSAQVLDMQGLSIGIFDSPGLFVLCCSTTGSGDVPDNAQALYSSLDAQARYLGHVRYGLVALGDSSYGDTFYGGAKAFQSRLQDLGAHLVGDVCVLDALAAAEPDAVALAWFAAWAQQARGLGTSAPNPT